MKPLFTRILISSAFVALLPGAAFAHFAWLAVNDDGQAEFFFGESLVERAYHLPAAMENPQIMRRDLDVTDKKAVMEEQAEEDFIGLRSDDSFERRGVWTTTVDYGLYHGTMLTYVATCYPSRYPAEWSRQPQPETPLQIIPQFEGDQLTATVYRNGEPLSGAKVMLYDAEGKLASEKETNSGGAATFATPALLPGLNALMVGYTDEDASGEWEGEQYGSKSIYATTTFSYDPERTMGPSALPPLPDAIASFGAAVSGDYVYVYGGHRGKAHDHSADNLSPLFLRTRVDGSGDWEELPMQTPLQGLALAAHGGNLYRVGGLTAANAAGEEAELHSVDQFACYDPAAGVWTELPPLPGPRSSHDAIVVGDTLYVVGGWRLAGDSDGEWQAGAVAFDLSNPKSGWRELPEPPFQRRALSVADGGDRLAVLCGMDEGAAVCKEVFLYDPQTEEWSEGPEFPGESFHGFGVSACGIGGDLYASGLEGVVYRLASEGTEWDRVAEIAVPRFFHRLLPAGENQLLVIGGATAEEGHARSSERIAVGSKSAQPRTARRSE